MTRRRSFMMSSGLTAALSRSAAGANDKIRMGVVGAGGRGAYMALVFATTNPDCEMAAVCDVFKPNRDKSAAALPGKPESYVDYRRVLERKDIDAVLVATPDHWHAPITAEACQAGKDVYCEKPVSNSIEAAWKAVEAARKYNRVVQVGLQQRSWTHFQEVFQWLREGKLGTVYHAGLHWQGSYTRPPEQPQEPPADLDWELFQGPAPRHPYTPNRQRSWRAFYDYGGGIVTDQGVHIADVVHWYLDAREPRSVAASGQFVAVPRTEEQLPDSFAITWQYDKFVMTYTNAYMPLGEFDNSQGNYFYGNQGAMHVNRYSYTMKPIPRRGRPGQPPPPAAFEAVNEKVRDVAEPDASGKPFARQSDRAHARDFLDCVKSRGKPLTDIETGFYSSLPLLLGVLALRTGKAYAWNGKQAVAQQG